MKNPDAVIAEHGFVWDCEISRLDDCLKNCLAGLLEGKTPEEKEFFRKEYARMNAIKSGMIDDWLAVW